MRNITRSNYTPHTGDYHNMIVHDPVFGKIWLFDCDGVFLDMSKTNVTVVDEYGDSQDYAASQRLVTATSNDLGARITGVDEASHERDDALEAKINQKEDALKAEDVRIEQESKSRDQAITDDYTQKYNSLDNDIEALTRVTNNLTTGVENIERTAVFGVTVDQSDDTKVALVVNDGGVTTTTQVRNASATKSGLMTSADYNQIRKNTDDIQHLQNSGLYRGSFGTLDAAPTTTPDPAFIGGEIYQNDFISVQQAEHEGETGVARYRATVDGTSVTYAFEAFIDKDIANFSAGNAGLIVGGTAAGTVEAQADGTGKVNGWDELSSQVSDNASNITALSAQQSTTVAELATVEQNLASLRDDLSSAEEDITALTGRVTTTEGDISANASAVTALQNKAVQAATDTTLGANTEKLLTVEGMMRQFVDITDSGLPASPDPDTFYYVVQS